MGCPWVPRTKPKPAPAPSLKVWLQPWGWGGLSLMAQSWGGRHAHIRGPRTHPGRGGIKRPDIKSLPVTGRGTCQIFPLRIFFFFFF